MQKIILPIIVFGWLSLTISWSAIYQLGVGRRAYGTPSHIPNPNMKTILLWTTWFQADPRLGIDPLGWSIPNFGFNWEGRTHSDLSDFGCDQDSYKCTITSNRSYLENESLYDGFMFSQIDINQGDIPDQTKRRANQVYMFQTMESPLVSITFDPNGLNYSPSINNNFFNTTMTYSSQSGIHTPFGKMIQTAVHPTGRELESYIATYGKQNARMMAAKTFSATTLVSNCASLSSREKVLSNLGKLMPVDIFGKCGKPPPSNTDGGHIERSDDTHKLLGQKYPFYLAFENSLCEDYVTEKFFSALRSNMIPVVMNGANMSKVAPKHSYIDIKDFATIRELANYLQEVSSDPTLYASYFWWRQFYDVQYIGRHFFRSFVKIFCEACRYLHAGKGPRVVEDLHKEWVEGSCRQPPVDQEETSHVSTLA